MDQNPGSGSGAVKLKTLLLQVVRKNKTFFILYGIFLFSGLIPLFLYSKVDIHLFINNFHSYFFDRFFMYITYLGSGVTAGLVVILLLFISIRYSMILAGSAITTGIAVQFLKRLVFYGCERPVAYFSGIAELYYIPGIDLHTHFSFPSGHSATAFIIFGLFALISDRKLIKIIALLAGLIISFSRVYLSQHFLVDILAGSLLGIIILLFFYWYFHTLKMGWINQPVQNFFRPFKK